MITLATAGVESDSFTYDNLGRVTRGSTASLTAPNTWDISWVYDRFANRTNQTQNGGTLAVTNSNLTFNGNNQPTGGFAFDAAGNMADDGVTHNYVYDAENRFVKLGTTVINTYDGANLRILKASGGTTVFVFAGTKVIAEYTPTAQVNAPTKEYIYLGSGLLATLDASHNPTYRQSDHLSARLYTDSSGNVIGTQGHLPFGESWYGSGTVDKWKFTMYERESDTSLDYAINRFDSPRLGRFMTTDPYDGSIDVSNPQSWNRYPYVMNDPVNLVDPLGLRWRWVCTGPADDRTCGWEIVDDPVNPLNCIPGIAKAGCSQIPGRTVLLITLTKWDKMHPCSSPNPPIPCANAANNCPGCTKPNQTVRQCADDIANTWSLSNVVPTSVKNIPVLGGFLDGALGNTVTNITSIYDFVVNDSGTSAHAYGVVLGAGPTLGVPVPSTAPAGLKGPVGVLTGSVAKGAGKFIGVSKVILDVAIYAEAYNFCKTGKY